MKNFFKTVVALADYFGPYALYFKVAMGVSALFAGFGVLTFSPALLFTAVLFTFFCAGMWVVSPAGQTFIKGI